MGSSLANGVKPGIRAFELYLILLWGVV